MQEGPVAAPGADLLSISSPFRPLHSGVSRVSFAFYFISDCGSYRVFNFRISTALAIIDLCSVELNVTKLERHGLNDCETSRGERAISTMENDDRFIYLAEVHVSLRVSAPKGEKIRSDDDVIPGLNTAWY